MAGGGGSGIGSGGGGVVVRVAGDKIGPLSSFQPGPGTFARGHSVFAAVSGVQRILPPEQHDKRSTVEVWRGKAAAALPEPGATIIALVTRVTSRAATTNIVCVNGVTVPDKFAGIVRQQDVRATEIDKVDMHSCFRPGDLIRAKVLSLGDTRAYFLTTASNELGVIHAKSTAGAPMYAVSWQEMRCPLTTQSEARKVAKTTPTAAAAAAP